MVSKSKRALTPESQTVGREALKNLLRERPPVKTVTALDFCRNNISTIMKLVEAGWHYDDIAAAVSSSLLGEDQELSAWSIERAVAEHRKRSREAEI